MSARIAALVPMRHHSERVPQKNYRAFAGRPLYHHILSALLDCSLIDEIVVDTDSSVILEGLSEHFPVVRAIERPDHLRADDVPMNEVLLHDVTQVAADFYLQTHSTNPLLRPETITRAARMFLDTYPARDSLFSVTRLRTRLWDGEARAINHDPAVLLRTQDLPPVYQENSCLYLFTRKNLELRHNRIGKHPLMFEIDSAEAWDIDEPLDFQITEFLYLVRQQSATGAQA